MKKTGTELTYTAVSVGLFLLITSVLLVKFDVISPILKSLAEIKITKY